MGASTIPVLGQAQNTGTVSGRVVDSTGASVVNATVVLQSTSDGRSTKAATNRQGEYTVPGVPVGSYVLKITADTFGDYTIEGIEVDAAGNLTFNATLRPDSASASLTVAAPASTVDTQSGSLATVIDPRLVDTLPLDGNNVVEVAALLPGVTNINAPTTFTSDNGGPTYNISGSRNNQNLFLLDGALWNNLYSNTGLNFPPRQALQEVSVITNNYKAEYGRNVGSVFNAVSRSGSNKFHGQAWDYIQNTALNAYDYISKANPHLVQNQFGATVAGPIWRDKLFFSMAVQDLRIAATVIDEDETLTLAQQGLQSNGSPLPCTTPAFAAVSTGCAQVTGSLYNPVNHNTTNGPIAITSLQTAWTTAGHSGTSPCVTVLLTQPATLTNSEIPSICFNPISIALNKLLPIPTTMIAGIPEAVSAASQPRNEWNGFGRVDWVRGRHTVSARYNQTAVDDHTANGLASGVGIANYEVDINSGGIRAGILDDTWVLSPNVLNIARVAYKRYIYNIDPTDNRDLDYFGGILIEPAHPVLPHLSVDTYFSSSTSGGNYSRSVNENFEFDDSLTWTHGTHNFQAGAEYLRLQYLKTSDSDPNFDFGATYTDQPTADYMMGLVQTLFVGNATTNAAIQHDVYMYAQDDWRATSRLTLNLGLRYELPFQWYEPDSQAATFIPGYQSQVFPSAPLNYAFVGDRGIKRSLVGTDYKNVAPRFGFAYDTRGNGKTIIRGGFGIFFDAVNALVVGVSEPYHFQATYRQPPGGLSQPLLGLNPIPANYVKGQPAQFVSPYSITFPDPKFQTPYTETMNLGFQQKILNSVLEMNYVGRVGRHLALGYDMNPAIYDCSGAFFQLNPGVYCGGATTSAASYNARVRYPGFNYSGTGVLDYMTIGSSSYSAGQLSYRYRSSKGLTTTISYTYSKSIDDSSSTGITNSTDQPTVSAKNSVSDFDTKHILNLGFSYSTPVITTGNRIVRAALNNWGLSGIYNAHTGTPFSCHSVTDNSLTDEGPEYCYFTPGGYTPLPSNRHRVDKIAEWVNAADLTISNVPTGSYGNVSRNFFRGPGYILPTMSARRTFYLGSDSRLLEFRVDAINIFNTPNLGTPSLSLSSDAAKNTTNNRVLNTVGNNGTVGTNGRRLQLSGTFRF